MYKVKLDYLDWNSLLKQVFILYYNLIKTIVSLKNKNFENTNTPFIKLWIFAIIFSHYHVLDFFILAIMVVFAVS